MFKLFFLIFSVEDAVAFPQLVVKNPICDTNEWIIQFAQGYDVRHEKVQISEIGRVKSVIGTTAIIKMDETIIASTSKWRGERKEGEKDATRSITEKNQYNITRRSIQGDNRRHSSFHWVFFIPLLLLFYIFLFVTKLIVGATAVSQNNKILFRWKQKKSANGQRAKSYNSACRRVWFRSNHHLMFRGWFI